MNHFLSLADLSPDQLAGLLDLAVKLKKERMSGGNKPVLKGKTLGMIFTKPSLRTRVSFDMGMLHLGGQALYVSPNEVSLGQRESVADVARVLSRIPLRRRFFVSQFSGASATVEGPAAHHL
ncbi:MAG TPA: hypothetical protein VII92_16365, partial [Anaerolineae bacterium]